MTLLKSKKVLIIGAGPTRIGQSAECDEGAAEAASALQEAGCRVVSVDANPNALLTDTDIVDRAYLEPLTVQTVERIVDEERPDAIVPIFGGRTGLHLAVLWEQHAGTGDRRPQIWGTPIQSLQALLERDALTSTLSEIGMATPAVYAIHDVESAIEKAQEIGFPVTLRCDDANLIPDGVLVYNQDELRSQVAPMAKEDGITLSVEASLRDWHQAEVEILRDGEGVTLAVGIVEYMQNADVHPGDAIGVVPPQTIAEQMRKHMEDQAATVADHFNIVGSATIRFAYQSEGNQSLILAVHPRYTRTSALVSRAYGIAIGRIAALLSAGLTWPRIPSPYALSLPLKTDIVAVKWPRWEFERLEAHSDLLGPQMQSIGQGLALGRSFKEALQKALYASNTNRYSQADAPAVAAMTDDRLHSLLAIPNSRRPALICEAFRRGATVDELAQRTQIAPGFIEQLQLVVKEELESDPSGTAAGTTSNIPAPVSTFNLTDTSDSQAKGTILLLGSGPEQIGQGSECDHGLYHAAKAVKEAGFRPVIINSNLASLTTGPSFPAKCYCEAVTAASVRSVADAENAGGIIFQFAGSSCHELVPELSGSGIAIMGISGEQVQLLQSRPSLWSRIRELGIPQPSAALVHNREAALAKSAEIDFPLLVEPAHANGVKQAQLISNSEMLNEYMDLHTIDQDNPLFIQRFLEFAIEAQAEVLSDASKVHVAAVLEHIELAGVNAGDSAWVSPPYSIAPRHTETIVEYARKVILEIGARGAFNLRFAIYRDTVYLLDATYGMSRNMALVAKTSQLPVARLATHLILGAPLEIVAKRHSNTPCIGVRAAVFPFNVFPQMDPLLGTRMKSTGDVLAMADSFGMAYFKALEAAETPLPLQGTVLITVTDEDKPSLLEPARIFQELGFEIMATRGTHEVLAENGIQSKVVRKLGFGRPNLVDEMKSGRVQMVINTPTGGQSQKDGSYIRQAAIRYRIANITTPASSIAAAKGIAARRQGETGACPLPIRNEEAD